MAKIALVTGASGGIGSACAKKLAEDGYTVIVHYYRHKEEAEHIASRIGGDPVQADLRSEAAVDALVDEVLGKYGRIDVLVNNAGISRVNQVQDVSNFEWDLLQATNATSTFLMTRAVLPSMIEARSGAIVNIASMWGIAGGSCESAYSASKGAVIAFTKAVAKEVGPSGIRVNCVAPGLIFTKLAERYSKEDVAAFSRKIPVGRGGKVEEIVPMIQFLADVEKTRFIVGQVICVDGGQSCDGSIESMNFPLSFMEG